MNPADILDAAADYIEVHGWRNDAKIGANGEACAFNAIFNAALAAAATPTKAWMSTFPFEMYLCREHANKYGIGTWNDEQPNQYPVIDALRLCAKDLRNEANL